MRRRAAGASGAPAPADARPSDPPPARVQARTRRTSTNSVAQLRHRAPAAGAPPTTPSAPPACVPRIRFEDIGHSEDARRQLADYLIGDLDVRATWVTSQAPPARAHAARAAPRALVPKGCPSQARQPGHGDCQQAGWGQLALPVDRPLRGRCGRVPQLRRVGARFSRPDAPRVLPPSTPLRAHAGGPPATPAFSRPALGRAPTLRAGRPWPGRLPARRKAPA